MNTILIPVVIVAAMGLVLGLGLAVASKVFAVPVDEKAEKIRACPARTAAPAGSAAATAMPRRCLKAKQTRPISAARAEKMPQTGSQRSWEWKQAT